MTKFIFVGALLAAPVTEMMNKGRRSKQRPYMDPEARSAMEPNFIWHNTWKAHWKKIMRESFFE